MYSTLKQQLDRTPLINGNLRNEHNAKPTRGRRLSKPTFSKTTGLAVDEAVIRAMCFCRESVHGQGGGQLGPDSIEWGSMMSVQ